MLSIKRGNKQIECQQYGMKYRKFHHDLAFKLGMVDKF